MQIFQVILHLKYLHYCFAFLARRLSEHTRTVGDSGAIRPKSRQTMLIYYHIIGKKSSAHFAEFIQKSYPKKSKKIFPCPQNRHFCILTTLNFLYSKLNLPVYTNNHIFETRFCAFTQLFYSLFSQTVWGNLNLPLFTFVQLLHIAKEPNVFVIDAQKSICFFYI